MLSIEELDIEIAKLYELDNLRINKINNLFMEMYGMMDTMKSLKRTIADQACTISMQGDDIRKLTDRANDRKLYRVVWKTGHAQLVLARSATDAHIKAMQYFTGGDRIVDISVNQSQEW